MKSKLLKIMIITLSVLAVIAIAVFIYMQQEMFGALPKGERLERIKQSPHYIDGAFQNISNTPTMSEDVSFMDGIKDFFNSKNKKPQGEIPSKKNNLLNLKPDEDVLVWFGHSSYFMQIEGKTFLIDPVLSGSASPVPFTVSSFKGSDIYEPKDLPQIDYLLITHDHWDHLDYKTIKALKPKINKIITGLGIGAHFERWGFDATKIVEKEWGEKVELASGFVLNVTPGRHFSGRGFKPNKAMWASFALQSPGLNIFIGGDSGYDSHFKEIGEKHGPFDLAILENGQYDRGWKYIHMKPEETLRAAKELNAKRLFPVHSGKFALANHEWDTPLKDISSLNEKETIPLVTPIIGEFVYLKNEKQIFSKWWEKVE